MKFVTILSCLVFLATSVSTQSSMVPTSPNENQSVVTTIAQMIVDWISRAFQYGFELIDLKVRSVRFLTSLYTTDNLVLVKRFLNIGLRFGGWVYDLIPNSAAEGTNRFLSVIFPQVDQKNGDQFYDEVPMRPGYGNGQRRSGELEGAIEENLVKEYDQDALSLHQLINGSR